MVLQKVLSSNKYNSWNIGLTGIPKKLIVIEKQKEIREIWHCMFCSHSWLYVVVRVASQFRSLGGGSSLNLAVVD